jgi:hypothetical protein
MFSNWKSIPLTNGNAQGKTLVRETARLYAHSTSQCSMRVAPRRQRHWRQILAKHFRFNRPQRHAFATHLLFGHSENHQQAVARLAWNALLNIRQIGETLRRAEVERVVPNALFDSAIRKRLEDKSLHPRGCANV